MIPAALIVLGAYVALTTPPLSGGTILGAVLIVCGGWVAVRGVSA